MKLIRELCWGPPKSFKTGHLLTFPKPMLVFLFDVDGLSILPSKNMPRDNALIQFDCVYEDVVYCAPGKLKEWVNKPMEQQPKVLCVDYTKVRPSKLNLEYLPLKSQEGLQLFQDPVNGDFNQIAGRTILPWKTVGWDGVTGYMETVLSHFSSMNPNRMADARDWAFRVGQMVKAVMVCMTMLPCHVVVLMHDELDKNELNGQVNIIPSVYGKELKNISGGLFSQYFYAKKNSMGKPVILSNDAMFLKGLGGRWPILNGETSPEFNSIYGKEIA